MRQCSTEYAQVDPALLEFGLFKSLSRNQNRERVSVSRDFAGKNYTVTSPSALDDLALKILLVLCALAGLSTTQKKPSLSGGLRDRLALSSETPQACAVWQGTLGDVLREADMQSGGNNRERVLGRLHQLSGVRISKTDKSHGGSWQSNLISYSESATQGEIRVAFSPGLSARILRETPVQYSHIMLDPFRLSDCPAARILHAILSSRIRVGAIARYSLEKLADIVYLPSDNPADMRKRKSSIRTAMRELAGLGWEFRQAKSASQEVFEICHSTQRRQTQVGPATLASTMTPQFNLGRIPAWRSGSDPRGIPTNVQLYRPFRSASPSQVP